MSGTESKDSTCGAAGSKDSLPLIPPEWVPLAKLPEWIARIYDVSGEAVTRDIGLGIRNKMLEHRIPGIQANFPGTYPSLPPGLAQHPRIRERIVMADEKPAKIDWPDGTVGGWERDGVRPRLNIEVKWHSLELFACVRVPGWRRSMKDEAGKRPVGPAQKAAVQTIAAVTGMTAWLTQIMQNNPHKPITKETAIADAHTAGLRDVSGRAFDRAWQEAAHAANAPDWIAKGRRKRRS